jgi:hypothetical protein
MSDATILAIHAQTPGLLPFARLYMPTTYILGRRRTTPCRPQFSFRSTDDANSKWLTIEEPNGDTTQNT